MEKKNIIFCKSKPSKPEDFILRRYKDSLNACTAFMKLRQTSYFIEMIDDVTAFKLVMLQARDSH